MIYRWYLYLFCFCTNFGVLSCGQDVNSDSGDAALARVTGTCSQQIVSELNLCKANAVVQKHCAQCHGDWSAYTTDAAWKQSGRVVAGSSASSTVFTRLINNGGDMPKSGSALPDADVAAIKTWIDGMVVQNAQ